MANDRSTHGIGAERSELELNGIVEAVERSQAVIEFSVDGTILAANANFLKLTGYKLEEIVGKHHRMFCTEEYSESPEYAEFWEKLGRGQYDAGEYKRIGKGGKEVWIQATYNPILDETGTPIKVVKFASDVTETKRLSSEARGKMDAVDRAQAVIEFDLTGRILAANSNFLDLMGYSLDEIIGKHHRIFCEPEVVKSYEYAEFWEKLGRGQYDAGEYKRIGKGGKEVWIQATYNPILDETGTPIKVVKFASDVTESKLRNAEISGRVDAVDRAQAVIEFDLSGNVITANQNFLDTMGYTLGEVVGKHHRMFCEPDYVTTEEYATFWEKLGRGQYDSGEYKRIGKGGKEVWIQATYNPIFDISGKPFKVVKFAVDVTQAKLQNAEVSGRMDAVDRAQAVIEFDLEGYVSAANENFLRVMGYSNREIIGQHHSMFCDDEYKRSEEYRDFWLRLGKGEVISGRFHRVGKFGRDVHIQATYNPIFDLSGNPTKVVKFAYDVTPSVERENRIATNTQEMTVAVQNLAGSIDSIMTTSSEATGFVKDTSQHAGSGGSALKASLDAISQIESSSQSISDIVQTMTDLASETNLLAFNASIEAARAGEHGVGFSIVADEVRKLAERSFEAAQKMSKLVEESTQRVGRGAEVCGDAQQAFDRLSTGIDQTSVALETILGSISAQKQAFGEVNELMSQLAVSNV